MATTEHPSWCGPSYCANNVHQAEPVPIRENLLAVLRQKPGQPPRIALELWDGPDEDQPAELILLDLADGAMLADALNMLTERAWRDR